jgi:uncharacterized RDD family membrane protein YckC
LGGLFARFLANLLDALALYGVLVIGGLLVFEAGTPGAILGLLVILGGVVGWFYLLARGLTPGKAVFGLRVRKTSGESPGLVTMLLREWVGKFVSGLFFSLGFLWAIFDRDRQAWHDKIAGTVVVKVGQPTAAQ